jgi:hypothetical protein
MRAHYAGQPNVGTGPGGTSVLRAPFEVQDDKGKPILRVVERGVASRGLYVFNEQGKVAAQVAVLSDGGGRVFVYPGNQPFGGITTPAFAAIAYPSKGPVLEMTRPMAKSSPRSPRRASSLTTRTVWPSPPWDPRTEAVRAI